MNINMTKREAFERAAIAIRSGIKTQDAELLEDGLQLLEQIKTYPEAKRIAIAVANAADQLRY